MEDTMPNSCKGTMGISQPVRSYAAPGQYVTVPENPKRVRVDTHHASPESAVAVGTRREQLTDGLTEHNMVPCGDASRLIDINLIHACAKQMAIIGQIYYMGTPLRDAALMSMTPSSHEERDQTLLSIRAKKQLVDNEGNWWTMQATDGTRKPQVPPCTSNTSPHMRSSTPRTSSHPGHVEAFEGLRGGG